MPIPHLLLCWHLTDKTGELLLTMTSVHGNENATQSGYCVCFRDFFKEVIFLPMLFIQAKVIPLLLLLLDDFSLRMSSKVNSDPDPEPSLKGELPKELPKEPPNGRLGLLGRMGWIGLEGLKG